MFEQLKQWWEERKRKNLEKKMQKLQVDMDAMEILFQDPFLFASVVYPCKLLFLSVYFEQEAEYTAVDLSEYDKKNIAHFMIFTKDKAKSYDNKLQEQQSITTCVRNGTVYLKNYANGGEGWCFIY